jgi:hypothetical protein
VSTPAAKLASSQQQQRQPHQAGHVRFVDSDAEETAPGELADHAERAAAVAVPHTPAQPQAAVSDANDTGGGYNAQPWDYSRQQERRQKRAGQRHIASVIALQPAQVVLYQRLRVASCAWPQCSASSHAAYRLLHPCRNTANAANHFNFLFTFGTRQADEDRLQPLTGEPQPGDVLSYRLLEIGESFSPQVCCSITPHPAWPGCIAHLHIASQDSSAAPQY